MLNFLKRKSITNQSINKYNALRSSAAQLKLCHAPHKNLLFIQSGAIMMCHYNRGFRLGSYPETQISDIHKSTEFKGFLKQLNHFEFPESCSVCKASIAAENYNTAGCKKYDFLVDCSEKNQIVSIEFQTSNMCNLECIMCSGEYSSLIRKKRENGQDYSNPYNQEFIEQINTLLPQLKYASFTGGEPFLNPLYYRIWENISKINPAIKINISSNGTVLNEKNKSLISTLNFELTVSIDSINKEIYEGIRQNAVFEETMQNIKYFIESSKKNGKTFSVKFVVMRQNIEYINELFEYFNEQDVQLYPKPVWVPFEQSLRYGNQDEFDSWINLLKSVKKLGNTEIQKQNILRFNELEQTLTNWKEEANAHQLNNLLKLDSKTLIENFRNELNTHIANDFLIDTETRELLYNQIDKITSSIYLKGFSENELKKTLANILSLPLYMVANEVYRMDAEKFLQRMNSVKTMQE